VLEGTHDFNINPWAPPGTRAIIHNPAEKRSSWAPRGIDAWYLGPAKDHYRCMQFYVPETKGIRISGSYKLNPQYCKTPINPTMEELQILAENFIKIINKLKKGENTQNKKAIEEI